MTRTNSLATRFFILTSLWAVLSIALIAWIVSENYRTTAENRMAERLLANLYNLMGSVLPDETGVLAGNPDLRDSRYLGFNSGYYWSVSQVGKPGNTLKSASLSGAEIPAGEASAYDEDFQRRFFSTDAASNRLVGIEAQAFLGDGDNLFSFRITANRDEIDSEVRDFIRRFLVLLTLFALGFILATFFIVRFALAPLRRLTANLTEIREGRAQRLEGTYPDEITPLVEEANSLIKSNNAVIERARTQVGNLAHSLKTPLAVLRNEAKNAKPAVKRVMEDQVNQMQSQVTAYLDRARISARSGSVTSRTDVRDAVSRLIRVMAKLNPSLAFSSEIEIDRPAFAGEQQDFEELTGNLLENAAKFAASKVVLTVREEQGGKELLFMIDDDGPGMSGIEMEQAIKRGMRIDESKPGSGLGLSIVKDIISEYGGTLALEKSPLGGLRVRFQLPRSH